MPRCLGFAVLKSDCLNNQVKKMYRDHKEYKADDSWVRQMEAYEHRPDMLTCYENVISEVCRQSSKAGICRLLAWAQVCRSSAPACV